MSNPALDALLLEQERLAKLAEANRAEIEWLRGTDTAKPVTGLKDFLSEDHSNFSWLIENVLACGSLAMLVADPYTGKSFLAAQLALCVAAGRQPFYDMKIPAARPTLYIAAEGARAQFQKRIHTACQTMGIDPAVTKWFIQADRFTDYQIGSRGLEACVETSGAKLVVLDTFPYFAKPPYDENSAMEWKSKVAIPLTTLAQRYDCSFLLVHHQVKNPGENRQGWQKARGSGAMFGDVDTWLRLEPVGDETQQQGPWHKRQLILDKMKYAVPRSWSLTFDGAKARFG